MTKTLNTQVQEALAGLDFELAKTRKDTDYKIYNITDCDAFWELWNSEGKEKIKALGYVVFKKDRYSGEYYLRDMSTLEYDCSKKASKARSLENLEKAREVKQANDDARKALKPAKVAKPKAKKSSKPNVAGMSPSQVIKFAQAMKMLDELGFDVTQVQM